MPTPDEQPVTALYERWVKAGPPPLGASLARWWDRRLIELRDAIGHADQQQQPGQSATGAHPMTIVRRYGTHPADRCSGQNSCPDVLRLDNGDYLIIGKTPRVPHVTVQELARHGAGIGDDEQAVVVPAAVMHAAALAIAEEALTRPLDLGRDGEHIYLSTGCLHGDHAYCQSMAGLNGAKRPASCKKCGAACICPCHQEQPDA